VGERHGVRGGQAVEGYLDYVFSLGARNQDGRGYLKFEAPEFLLAG